MCAVPRRPPGDARLLCVARPSIGPLVLGVLARAATVLRVLRVVIVEDIGQKPQLGRQVIPHHGRDESAPRRLSSGDTLSATSLRSCGFSGVRCSCGGYADATDTRACSLAVRSE